MEPVRSDEVKPDGPKIESSQQVPLPPENDSQGEIVETVSQVVSRYLETHAIWSSPFLPASELAALDKVCPGTSTALVEEWREENKHRRNCENRELNLADTVVQAQISNQLVGMVLGSTLSMTMIIGGCMVVVLTGTTAGATAGAAIAGTGAVAMISSFVAALIKQNSQPKPRRPKKKEPPA